MYIANGGFNLSAAILKLIIILFMEKLLEKCMEFQELVIVVFGIILSGFFYNTESKFEHPGSTYPPKTYLSTPTPRDRVGWEKGYRNHLHHKTPEIHVLRSL